MWNVFLFNATSTSGGVGPGVVSVPTAEGQALVDAGYGVIVRRGSVPFPGQNAVAQTARMFGYSADSAGGMTGKGVRISRIDWRLESGI